MYSNKGKRDILIFPNFDNIDKIQAIRKKYDSLADLILPHITLVFPFSDEISDVELFEKLSCLLKNFSPFEVSFSGVSLSDDNYIFLNCIQGSDSIVKLHDEIYDKIFPSHFKFHSFLASLKGTHRNESLELKAFSLYNTSKEYTLQSTQERVADFCNFQIKSVF